MASPPGSTTTEAIPGARPPSRATTVYSPGGNTASSNSPRSSVRSVGGAFQDVSPTARTVAPFTGRPPSSRTAPARVAPGKRKSSTLAPARTPLRSARPNPRARAESRTGARPMPSRRKRPSASVTASLRVASADQPSGVDRPDSTATRAPAIGRLPSPSRTTPVITPPFSSRTASGPEATRRVGWVTKPRAWTVTFHGPGGSDSSLALPSRPVTVERTFSGARPPNER